MTDFSGKTVIVTGASRGIGAATAREFAKRGANVVLSARSTKDIENVAAEITKSGGNASAFSCDVSNYNSVVSLVEHCVASYGIPDVLINNAGVLEPVERLENANPDAWDQVIDINIKGVFYGIRAALPLMRKNGGGTIITIGSGAATSALEGWSAYCTSKAAVHHLNHCLHAEESHNGIRALVLSPGTVATDMQVAIRDSGVNPVSQIPWENHIPVDWPARALAWMATTSADHYLGKTISLREDSVRKSIGLI
ncbi:short-chain dehydrogenase [Amylibacter kogurei]|uniref:Short-chain dehydrogenase n=1 Tax=Paramylibacter kogurei TaxID=1889778 RepID=A0A2G5K2Y8_9RHOB|nr:SDR family oxidoreductase [Amylibacter kogurei]PIB23094.1 short-chain dehydrogenase [Amylibacter kogurei]